MLHVWSACGSAVEWLWRRTSSDRVHSLTSQHEGRAYGPSKGDPFLFRLRAGICRACCLPSLGLLLPCSSPFQASSAFGQRVYHLLAVWSAVSGGMEHLSTPLWRRTPILVGVCPILVEEWVPALGRLAGRMWVEIQSLPAVQCEYGVSGLAPAP